MFRRLGRWTYLHRRLVVAVWVLVVLSGLPLIPSLPRLLKPGGFADPSLEAQQASDVAIQELGQRGAVLVAVFPIEGTGFTSADDPAFLDAADAQLAPVAQLPFVERVVPPRLSPRQVAPDKQAALAPIVLKSDADGAVRLVGDVQAAIGSGPLTPVITGGPVAYADIIRVSEHDLRRAELISIPLALTALVVVFGSVVAAGMPVLIGGLSVAVALAVLSLVAHTTDLSVFVLNLATMLGLGLGTDYSLFITSRFREELRAGRDVGEAVERTVEHAGKAVFFSGLTVFIGLSGLVTFNFMMLRSLGLGGAIVVMLGVIAALTLLPAVLGIIGTRIESLTLLRWNEAQEPLWTRLAAAVMRRPWQVLVPVLALLLALGAPFLQARFSLPDAGVLPKSVESRRGYDLIQQHWGPGDVAPIQIVVVAPGSVLTKERVDALYDLSRFVARDPQVARVDSIVDLDPRMTKEQYELLYAQGTRALDPYTRASLGVGTSERATTLNVTPKCSSIADECVELVHRLRALRPGADLRMLVGGAPSAIVDIVDSLYGFFPYAAGLVITTTYLVLLVLFRSVLLPLKAILMNGLSLVASYGALVVVFQEGHGARLMGFEPLGYVEATLPIIMFCLLFGLSMDYEVFLLARIKEAYDGGASNTAAVAAGLASSGRVITNAALIVVLVSLSFVSAEVILVKAVGLGTALAVLLDATVVRALLVPATMRLLGNLNWWAPRPLRAALAASVLLLVACAPGQRYVPRSTPVPTAAASSTAAPRPVTFPRDDAPHDDLTEWWYYTGHLRTDDGGQYGFELVVFQSVRGGGPVGYAAHYAITDVPRGRFQFDQRTSVGSQIDKTDGFDLKVGDWAMSGANGHDHLVAAMPGYGLNLRADSQKPAALHNKIGLISFGPAGDSYYYSRTRMDVTGTLALDGEPKAVTGLAWMDHQWGNFLSAGGGWDWFSVQLDDRTELTGSVVRDDAGNPVLIYGTYVGEDGQTVHLGPEDFVEETTGSWTSATTGATYPAGWRLLTKQPRLELELLPVLSNQELDTRATTGVAYWEGAVAVGGLKNGQPVKGQGYVELTGYARGRA